MFFLQGFCVSLLNAVWIASAHVILYVSYIAQHSEEAKNYGENRYVAFPKTGDVGNRANHRNYLRSGFRVIRIHSL